MITHLSVKNYRSLKDLELDLGPLVVLIGPNGSGKSNILDVLRLVQEVAASGQNVGAAFSGRGGYDQVVWGGERGREIAIDVAWKTPARRDGSPGTYSVRLSENDHKSVGFENETLTTEAGDSLTMTGRSRFEFKDNSGGKSPGSMPAGYSVVSSFGADKWPDPALINSMFRWSFYRFDPLTMRTPQPVRREYGLVESGQNLSTVIHTLFFGARHCSRGDR